MKTKQFKIGKLEILNIKQLNPSAINRAIDDSHVNKFEAKLRKFGWMDVIKVDCQYNILEGHHRYYAAIKAGQEVVPVYVVTWLDNLTEKERLKIILEYNASNLNWKNEDYLEKYAEIDQSYNDTLGKYNKYNTNLSTGTILKLYMDYSKTKFITGDCVFRTGKMPDYLADKLSSLVDTYGKSKAQSYCLREIVNVSYKSNSLYACEYILKRYKDMLENDHAKLTSIKDFRLHINDVLSEYLQLKND
jgi:hypothetical protein